VSNRARPLLQALATLVALAAIGGALWWATQVPSPASVDGDLSEPAVLAAVDDAGPTVESVVVEPSPSPSGTAEPADLPTPRPTPSPAPTATPIPEPIPFVELIERPDLDADLSSPMPECSLTSGADTDEGAAVETMTGTVIVRCIETWERVEVVAAAPGRIVHVVDQPAQPALLNEIVLDGAVPSLDGTFSWRTQGVLGPHVVVDHGPRAGRRSVQTVYAGLSAIESTVAVGAEIDAGQVLGVVDGPAAELRFGLWMENVRQDGARVVLDGPDETIQRQAAEALGPIIASPTDPLCPLSLGSTRLPGANRAYRNGVHQGIDFGCGASERFGHAIADGTVVYLVDDYRDPTVPEREALLQNAAIAGDTPHWTLLMLYGNVVVIDHGEVAGVGRLYTIAAHLEQVDDAIELGGRVVQGQVLGELGNRGTNASAEGRRGAEDPSLHLHWELFIDGWYLGAGQTPAVVEELVVAALCGAAETPGCPVG